MNNYRRLSYQPLSTQYYFKPDRPFDKAITAKGSVMLKLIIAGTEYGPYSLGMSTRKNTWEGRHSLRPRPTSQQLKESLGKMEALIDQAHAALIGELMTGEIILERMKILQAEGNQTFEKPKEKISYRGIIHGKLSVRFAFRPTDEFDESETAPGQVELFLWLHRHSDGGRGPFFAMPTNRSIWMSLNMLINPSQARTDLIRAKQRLMHQIELAYLTLTEQGLNITGEMIMDQVNGSVTNNLSHDYL